ncbi:hypothetical protein EYC84_003131 [Monilinia fructicola]|uniref:Uncharacterized protein n=1 Tax=Monilinia fructicola TaxID=38448 RepID=A0A5M9K0U3_MONFR|nr:hypothetical protein EYC84_003131 [Monilinia fructicola]
MNYTTGHQHSPIEHLTNEIEQIQRKETSLEKDSHRSIDASPPQQQNVPSFPQPIPTLIRFSLSPASHNSTKPYSTLSEFARS